MSEIIRDLLRNREYLQGQLTYAKHLLNSLETIENNFAKITGSLGPGYLYVDRHLAADIAATHIEDMETELGKLNEKISAIETLLGE